MLNSKSTIIITGASDGIGKSLAANLAQQGFPLLLVGRNQNKTENVVKELKEINQQIDFEIADLSLQSEVQQLGKRLRERYKDGLDCLVNNAGAYFSEFELTSDGRERTLALNHFGYFLLTHELLPCFKPQAYVFNIASTAHKFARVNWQDLNNEQNFSGWTAYCNSKLLNIMFSYELGRRYPKLKVHCAHPGFVASKFGWNNQNIMGSLFKFGQFMFAISTEKSAHFLAETLCSQDFSKNPTSYYSYGKVRNSSKESYDRDRAKELWEFSSKALAN